MPIFDRTYTSSKIVYEEIDILPGLPGGTIQIPKPTPVPGLSRIVLSPTQVSIQHFTDGALRFQTHYTVNREVGDFLVVVPNDDPNQQHVIMRSGDSAVYWMGFPYLAQGL